MKKLTACALLLPLVFALSACGGEKSEKTPTPSPSVSYIKPSLPVPSAKPTKAPPKPTRGGPSPTAPSLR